MKQALESTKANEAKSYWLDLVLGLSIREIALKREKKRTSIMRSLIKYYGTDYLRKSKSSSILLIQETLLNVKSESKKEQIRVWLENNIESLVVLDGQLEASFYSDNCITSKEKSDINFDFNSHPIAATVEDYTVYNETLSEFPLTRFNPKELINCLVIYFQDSLDTVPDSCLPNLYLSDSQLIPGRPLESLIDQKTMRNHLLSLSNVYYYTLCYWCDNDDYSLNWLKMTYGLSERLISFGDWLKDLYRDSLIILGKKLLNSL